MKATLDSIKAGISSVAKIRDSADNALIGLCKAKVAFECSSPTRARVTLERARGELVTLRRTQTAALANIDAALKSLTP